MRITLCVYWMELAWIKVNCLFFVEIANLFAKEWRDVAIGICKEDCRVDVIRTGKE